MLMESSIIAWCLQHPEEMLFLSDRLKEYHFQHDSGAAIVWPLLLNAYNHLDRGAFPTLPEAHHLIRQSQRDNPALDLLLQYVTQVYSLTTPTDVTADHIREWVASRELYEMSIEIQKEVTNGVSGKSIDQVLKWQEKLGRVSFLFPGQQAGERFSPTDPQFFRTAGEHIEELYGAEPLPTGIVRLDRKLRDGGVRPYPVIIAGPTGVGKTALGMAITCNALKLGKRVVVITFDDNPGELSERFFSNVLQREFTYKKEKVAGTYDQTIQEICRKLESTYHGDFQGIYLDAETHTPQDLARELLKLQKSLYYVDKADAASGRHIIPENEYGRIDAIIIDTADQVKASRHYRSEWYEIGKTFQSLAILTKKFCCPVYLMVQAGQQAVGASQMTERQIGESYSKIKAAKLVLAVTQTFNQLHTHVNVNITDPLVRDNLHNMPNYNPLTDRETVWQPISLNIIKNTRARSGAGVGAATKVILPMLVNFASSRIIEDFTAPETAMLGDKQTVREEREYGQDLRDKHRPPGRSGAPTGKRGMK